MIIYSADRASGNPLAQINGCSLDIRLTSTVQLFVSSFSIQSPTQSWELERRTGEPSSHMSRTAKECKKWFMGWVREGGVIKRAGARQWEREREANEGTNHAKMRHDLLLFPFPSVCFLGAPPHPRAVQSLLLCVFMHKFRSSTKPWFLYSSSEWVMFLSIHNKKSQLIWLMTLFFYH